MPTLQALIDGYGPDFPGVDTLFGIEAGAADVLKMEQPIPALDRYLWEVAFLRNVTSGRNLGELRFNISLDWFLHLSYHLASSPGIPQDKRVVDRISHEDDETIRRLAATPSDILRAQYLEKFTEHDTAAATDYLKILIATKLPHLEQMIEGVHFPLTSEDLMSIVMGTIFNTVHYGHAIPAVLDFCDKVIGYVEKYETRQAPLVLPGLTHRQAAEYTTLGKKFMTTVINILELIDDAFFDKRGKVRPFTAKAGGALGNFTTHYAAYPGIDWEDFARSFIERYGLKYQRMTFQSSLYTVEAGHFTALGNILTSVMKFDQDFLEMAACPGQFFVKEKKKGTKGSSLMPNKSNLWEMEGAKAMLSEARDKLFHYAKELPSFAHEGDMQRSYLGRNIGDVYMPLFIGLTRSTQGLHKYRPNHPKIQAFFDEYPGMAGSVIQTVLKRERIEGDAYREIQRIAINVDGTYANAAQFRTGLEGAMERLGLEDGARIELRSCLDPQQQVKHAHTMAWEELDHAKIKIQQYRRALSDRVFANTRRDA